MSILGTIGNAAKGAVGNFLPVPGAGILASNIDPTPGYSATNVIRTQAAKLGGGGGGAPVSTIQRGSDGGGSAPPGGSSGGYASDPYAQYGGQAAYNNLRAGFNDQTNAVRGSAGTAADQAARARTLNILDFVDQLRMGQQGIESKAAANERARLQGTSDIRDSVGKGVRNVGQMLQGRNASGATVGSEIARALQDQGRRQSAGVENQYELGNMDIANDQNAINTQRESGRRRFEFEGTKTIEDITSAAEQQLSAINAAMANASLPDRIALDQEKQAIRARAGAALAATDATLYGGLGSVQAGNLDSRRAAGAKLMQAGTPMTTEFEYDTDIPIELQGTGPFSSELPLFTFNRDRREQMV